MDAAACRLARLRRLTRREVLRRAGALGVTLAAGGLLGCQPTEAPKPAASAPQPITRTGKELTMFVYSGLTDKAYRELFVPGFQAQSGAKVTLDPGWWDMAAKLKVTPSDQAPFDLVMTDPTQGFPGIRDGLFVKLDPERLPDAKRFAPKVLDSWIYRDGWGVPFVSSAMTLAWNTESVPGGLKSWGELFADGLKGEVMLYSAYYMSLFTFAAGKVALDGRPGTARLALENDLDGVFAFTKQKRDWVKFWWPATADAVSALLQRNVKAGNIHGNGLIQPLNEGKPLDLIIPKEDRAYVQLFFLVPKNTRDRRLAEDAINYIAGPEFQRNIADKTGELSCNIPDLAAELAPRNRIWARVYPNSREDWDSLVYYPYDLYDRNATKIVDFWNREVLRKTS
jgi:putative spermidine/putrescine transport system substrate-binding protein